MDSQILQIAVCWRICPDKFIRRHSLEYLTAHPQRRGTLILVVRNKLARTHQPDVFLQAAKL
jgi:hypothetical protein